MKDLYFFAAATLLFACYSYAEETNLLNPYVITYPFESAVIHYDIKNKYGHGKVSGGTEVAYIKGDRLAKVTKASVPDTNGKTKKVEALQIFTTDYVYRINLLEKTGIKVDNPKKYGIEAYENLSPEEKRDFHGRMEKRGIISLDLLGLGRKVGTDDILGRKCDVYQSGKELDQQKALEEAIEGSQNDFYTKIWVWRDAKVPLRILTSGLGWSNELIATKIEENASIPDSRFMVPEDMEITYDKKQSEFEKRRALARFELYKTGKPMVIRMKLDKEKVNLSTESTQSGSESNQETR